MQTTLLTQNTNNYLAQFCMSLKQSKVTATLVLVFSAMSYVPYVTASDMATIPSLTLTTDQMDALAIQTQKIAMVKAYPSSAFIAQSMVPLNQRYVVT
ncbi:MAG TPA: hypothetical protein ENK73_02255, partial [Thiomicrospira sp.]|nr:hypothetical protein [Thiomicrospira sp.]